LNEQFAAFGQSSLRMELTPASKAGERVRRTYTLTVEELGSSSWNLRTRVYVEDLNEAAVEMLVFVQDADGNTLAKPKARLEAETSDFKELAMSGFELPEGASKVSVQISIVADEAGGNGIAFWDGVELINGTEFAVDYCDGTHFGCAWEGEPHGSASSRVGGIDSLTVESIDAYLQVDRSMAAGESVFLEDGIAWLQRSDGSIENVGSYGSIRAGEIVLITMSGGSKPTATLLGP
jgi:hypothetical protein